MCANSWTRLISIRGLRKTNNRGKERLRLSLKRGGISGQIDTTTTDFRGTLLGSRGSANTQAVNVVFQELVHQVLEKIKNELFFKWPNKMARNPMRRNQNLYCQYHQDQGNITEDCRNFWDHLD